MNYKPMAVTLLCTSLLLFGCEKAEKNNSSTTEDKKIESAAQEKQTTSTKKENTKTTNRFESTIEDKDGRKYVVKISPIKEEKKVEEEGYGSVAKGDTVYSGDYHLILLLNDKEKQKITLKDLTINKDNPLFKVIEGKRDLLLIGQSEGLNINYGYVYMLEDGKLVQLKNADENTDTFSFSQTAFREVQPYFYQTAFYDNSQAKWTFSMYQLNESKHTLSSSSKETYEFEEGTAYYELHFIDTNE